MKTTSRFAQIVILHDRNETSADSPTRLQAILHGTYPEIDISKPYVPDTPTAQAFVHVQRHYMSRIRTNSLLVGFGRGGLIACAVQEAFPALRLSVVAINAPTQDGGLEVRPCQNSSSRVALYSSAYTPIKGRADWYSYTPMAFDVPWLANGHNTYYPLAYLISAFAKSHDMDKEVSMMFPVA